MPADRVIAADRSRAATDSTTASFLSATSPTLQIVGAAVRLNCVFAAPPRIYILPSWSSPLLPNENR
jgi:hypothetical protein